MEFLDFVIFGNTVLDWLVAAAVFMGVQAIYRLLRYATIRYLVDLSKKSGFQIDDLLTNLVRRTHTAFATVLGLYFAMLSLTLPVRVMFIADKVVVTTLILQLMWWTMGLIDYAVQKRIRADADQQSIKTTMNAIRLVLTIALWSVGLLFILQNVTGLEMNSLVAALGIGGVAIALAVQNILGDLFSSISISLDKPFVIGDNIAVDDFSGTVEYIGLKSTRLRSISGEELILSNSDLLSSRIRNYQRQERRREVILVRTSYDTSAYKLGRIPDLIKEIIAAQELVTFDRVYLKEFGELGFTFEIIYFVESANLTLFLSSAGKPLTWQLPALWRTKGCSSPPSPRRQAAHSSNESLRDQCCQPGFV